MISPFRCAVAALAGFVAVATVLAADSLSLPRSTPEKQGVASAQLLRLVEALDAMDQVHSLMLVRHGHVVAEGWWGPYDAATRHELYSLSKSFTSTAVGFAVAEGKVSVDDPVLKFFAADAPAEPGGNLKAMRVRDLLTMSTGHQDEPPTSPDKISAKTFLAQPVPHKPGTHFKYNTAATFMQSALVQRVTGQTALDYLRPRLFEPLGIREPRWDANFEGISLGGYGLRVRSEDIAKFGQLYLQRGRWQSQQLLPATWVEAATAKQVSNGSNPASDWDQGYGFQFWRCQHGAYRGDGAFGQYCVVLPEQDAVVAITSGLGDMQAVLNHLWSELLPAFAAKRLPADKATQDRLATKLRSLAVKMPVGAATSPRASAVFGQPFVFPANDQKLESLSLTPLVSDGWLLTRRINGTETVLRCGHGRWLNGNGSLGAAPRGPLGALDSEPLAASAAWTADDTFTVKVCARETPYQTTFTLQFADDEVTVRSQTNVGFGNTKGAPVVGRSK
jgi:CubicO group peptidase (beta-lactamase class C family)